MTFQFAKLLFVNFDTHFNNHQCQPCLNPPFHVFINMLLLILSGFPFQINLKQQDSISFVYLSGTVQELAMNVNFGKISDFIISIFPIMVRFLFSQDINNFFI